MNNENKDIKDIKSLEDNNNLKKEEKYASGMQVPKDDTPPKEVKDVSKEEISNSPSNLNKGNKELDNSKEENNNIEDTTKNEDNTNIGTGIVTLGGLGALGYYLIKKRKI